MPTQTAMHFMRLSVFGVALLAVVGATLCTADQRSVVLHSPANLATLTAPMRNAMIEADQTVRALEARGRALPDLRVSSAGASPGNRG